MERAQSGTTISAERLSRISLCSIRATRDPIHVGECLEQNFGHGAKCHDRAVNLRIAYMAMGHATQAMLAPGPRPQAFPLQSPRPHGAVATGERDVDLHDIRLR